MRDQSLDRFGEIGHRRRGAAVASAFLHSGAQFLDRVLQVAADTRGTAARVRGSKVTSKLKRGVYTAKIRVQCPASEAGGCAGALVLQTAKTVSLNGTRFHAIVASKRYTLQAGQTKTLKVKLPKGVRALSRRGTLSLNAITTNRDAAGNLAQRSSRLAIKLIR